MSAILVKDVPPVLHKQLKRNAEVNHRSLNKEILWRLEQSVIRKPPPKTLADVVPVKPRKPVTAEFIDFAKRWGRD